VSVAFDALLASAIPPAIAPLLAGVNVTFTVADCPGKRTVPMGKPLTLKPAPEILRFETVTFEPPMLETVTVWEALSPRTTFPKVRVAGLALIWPGVAVGLAAAAARDAVACTNITSTQ
jgi:hypothetical protein